MSYNQSNRQEHLRKSSFSFSTLLICNLSSNEFVEGSLITSNLDSEADREQHQTNAVFTILHY